MVLSTVVGDTQHSRSTSSCAQAGITPEQIPVVSFSIAEDELRELPPQDMVGDYAAWNYFQSIDRPENREFVQRFKDRVRRGPRHQRRDRGGLQQREALGPGGRGGRDGRRRRRSVKAIRRQSLNAPEGSSRSTPRPSTPGGRSTSARSAATASSTSSGARRSRSGRSPIPISRSRAEWDAFLENLYTTLGRSWANPRTLTEPHAPARTAESSSPRQCRTGTAARPARPRRDPNPTSTQRYGRPAMNLRTGSRPTGISIATRLLLWFLAISLIPCMRADRGHQLPVAAVAGDDRSASELLAISDAKTTQLENFIRERRGRRRRPGPGRPRRRRRSSELEQVGRTGAARFAGLRRSGRGVPADPGELRRRLRLRQHAISSTPTGTLLFRVKPDLDLGDEPADRPAQGDRAGRGLRAVRMLLQAEISDYQVYPGRSEPAAFIASPVAQGGRGRRRGGRRVRQRGGLPGLQRLQRAGRDRRDAGGDAQGRRADLRGPAAARPGGGLPSTGSRWASDRATAMQRAVQGQRGYGEAIDYRGRPVVAAWSYLPSFRWGMVVKQDVDEAFALIHQQRLASRPAAGADGRCSVAVGRLAGGPVDHPADPRGRPGGRAGGRGRPDRRRATARPRARPACCSRRSAR